MLDLLGDEIENGVYVNIDTLEYINYTNHKIINFELHDNGVNVMDAYLVKDDDEKARFIIEIMNFHSFEKREPKSLIREWKAHNICYRLGIMKSHAKDCYLDNNEKLYRRVFYWLITLLFKEK